MKMLGLLSFLFAATLSSAAFAASSINPANPAQGLPYSPAPIRLNFQAAVSDIQALQTLNAGATAPANPSLGYLWLSTPGSGATIDPLYVWDGNSWLPIATLDTANHLWVPPVGGGQPASILSAATTDLGSKPQSAINITGSNAISSFGSSAPVGAVKFVTLLGTPTISYNSTSLILPGAANIAATAGDSFVALQVSAGNWRVLTYQSNATPTPGGAGGIGNIVAASTTDLGSVGQGSINVAGSTTIVSFGSTASAGTLKYLAFSGTPVITFNGTSMILPGGGNITIAVGDTMLAQALGSGNWRVLFYQHVSSTAPCFVGTSPPSSPSVGSCWWNNTSSPALYEVYDGAAWLAVASIDATNHIWQTPISGGNEQPLTAASTVDLGSVPGTNITMSGTTSITSFGSSAVVGTAKIVTFSQAVTIGASTAIILPGATSITAQPGDVWVAKYLGSGNWRVISILYAAGANFLSGPTVPIVAGDVPVGNGGNAVKDAGAPPSLSVDTTAALAALPLTLLPNGVAVQVNGYYKKGDAPSLVYTLSTSPCTLNASTGDGGSQIPSLTSGNCWLKQPTTVNNVLNWGATGSTATATGCVNAGAVLTCSGGVADFQIGQYVQLSQGGAAYALGNPTVLTVTPVGAGGATAYYYSIAPVNGTAVGTPLSAATANNSATLGTAHDLSTISFYGVSTYNQLGWTDVGGTKPTSYLVYEGTTATLSAMTCIGMVDATDIVLTGIPATFFYDYGSTHYQTCPTWAPATPANQNAFFSSTIVGVNVGAKTITLAATPTNPVTNQTLYHDDVIPINNTLVSSPAQFSCPKTFNVFGPLFVPSAHIDGERCSTVKAYGSGFSTFNLGVGSNNAIIDGFSIDMSQSGSGSAISISGATGVRIFDSQAVSPPSMLYATNIPVRGLFVDRYYNVGGIYGYFGVFLTANTSLGTFINTPYFTNLQIGQMTDSGGYSFLIDGDVNSVTGQDITFQAGPNEVAIRNTLGTTGPLFGKFVNMAINVAWGTPLSIGASAGDDYSFRRLYLQGNKGNLHAGITLTAGSGPVTIDGGSLIFGNDYSGISDASTFLQTSCDTMIYANNKANNGTSTQEAKVAILAGAGPASICLANGDSFSGNGTGGNPTEQYGIWLTSGINGGVQQGYDFLHLTKAGPGIQGPICGTIPPVGSYDVDGVEDYLFTCGVDAANNFTLNAAQTVTPFGLGAHVWISGATAANNLTLPTAAAILAQLQSPANGQVFVLTATNLNTIGNTMTLVANTKISVAGSVLTQARQTHKFTCLIVDATGAATPSITCTG